MEGIIYKILNNVNNKIYVGLTMNESKRYKQHFTYALQNHYVYVDKCIRDEGVENFSYEVLERFENLGAFQLKTKLDERERYWINELNSLYPNGYNYTDGGHNSKLCESKCRENSYRQMGHECTAVTRQRQIDTAIYLGRNKPVVQLSITDEFVNEFPSVREAARFLFGDIKYAANIRGCLKGRCKTCLGYKFVFKNDYEEKHDIQ